MTHLDTSFLIRGLVAGTPERARLASWLKANEPIAISAVCWTEFLCGPVSPREAALAEQLLGAPHSFTAGDAALAARLFNVSGRRRGSLIDCMVAAQSMGANASLATSNRADFQRLVPFGVQLAEE